MYSIAKREFMVLFKSIKSIIIVLIFLLVAYSVANFVHENVELLKGISTKSNPYITGIRFMVICLGFLFVLSLSHDTVNKEIESQTIRFLVTRTSKKSILIGKYLGILLFWIYCIGISFLVVTIQINQLLIYEFLKLLCFITYIVGVDLVISSLIKKSALSMFLSLLIGIFAPVFGVWSIISSNPIINIVKYFTPYPYIVMENCSFLTFIPFLLSILMLSISIMLFRRKDL